MCERPTTVFAVVHDDGETAHPPDSTAILLEIAEGPHKGKRGADWQLRDLAGPIWGDRSTIVSYETGKQRPMEENHEQR